MPKIQFSQCSYLTHPEKTYFLSWDSTVTCEVISCPIQPMHQRAGRRTGPLYLRGHRLAKDEIGWTWQSDLIVGVDVARTLAESDLSGFELVPAFLNDRDVFEVKVTGFGGEAPEDSGIHVIERCDACGLEVYSCFTNPQRLLNSSAWDGSDFFFIWPLPLFIFGTPKSRTVLEQFPGISFKAPLSLKCEGSLSPGKLHFYRRSPAAPDLA